VIFKNTKKSDFFWFKSDFKKLKVQSKLKSQPSTDKKSKLVFLYKLLNHK